MVFEELQERASQKWQNIKENSIPYIRVGTATCGLAAGAKEVIVALEDEIARRNLKVNMMQVGCIGTCYAEPVIDIKKPGGPRIFYGLVTPEIARELIKDYIIGGNPRIDLAMGSLGKEKVEGINDFFDLPMLKPQVRIVLKNCGHIDPRDIDQYIASGGFGGLKKALSRSGDEVIEEVKKSGIRGRGGAGFPTGIKWEFCRKAPGTTKYIICNADEGDPGAFMDRSALEGDPYAVLEGMLIGGYAIGAGEGYIYCRAEYPLAIELIENALRQMEKDGLVGDNILGSGFNFHFHLFLGAGAFVCGEETALMASIEGKPGRPRPRPPFPAVSGLFGKPTNINNVETWANVPRILNQGSAWFSSYGTEHCRGTKTLSLTGKIVRSGLIEVPMGIPINQIIYEIGGGIINNGIFKGVQTGGPSGGSVPASLGDTPVDYESLAALGTIMGSGGMVVLDDKTCMVDMAKYFLEFTRSESCGQCTPCREGTKQMYHLLDKITKGEGRLEDLDFLKEMGEIIIDTSLCGLGQTLPKPVLTTLKYFSDEYREHIISKRCPAAVCRDIVYAPCEHTCPLNQDVPSYIAYIAKGKFDEALEVILRDNPFPRILGRVCNHPCEACCRSGEGGEPIAIRLLKRFVTDTAEYPPVQIPQRHGKKVAIVGSGPAGLSAAYCLAERGYDVTIFEALSLPGGMLRMGIPGYRLPRKILEAEIERVCSLGVTIQTNSTVGEDITIDDLFQQEFKAIFIATGAHENLRLNIPGEDAEGVINAVEFLRAANMEKEISIGRNVVVIGGGNAAIDAARTAWRLNKGGSVRIIYRRSRVEMPAIADEIEEALREGVEIKFLTAPVRVVTNGEKVQGITCIMMKLGEIDASGRSRPVAIEGSEFTIDADTVIPAIGQRPDLTFSKGLRELNLSKKGAIIVDLDTLSTARQGVFAGGDVVTGPFTVAAAVESGKVAAESIDRYLRGKSLEREHKVKFPAENVEPVDFTEEELASLAVQKRVRVEQLPVSKRMGNFSEIESTLTKGDAMAEARRCLRCDIREEGE